MGTIRFTEDITKDPKRLKEQLNIAFQEVPPNSPVVNSLSQRVSQLEQTTTTVISQAVESISTIVMSDTVNAFDVITSDGKKADSANTTHSGKVVGIILQNTLGGSTGQYAREGSEVTNGSWAWLAGSKLFLNGTSLSVTAPTTGFSQRIGTAKTPVVVVIEFSEPVIL